MKYKILLVAILLLGFVLRLYRIDNPIGDWHAFRQADTSAVSKEFLRNGFNVLTPTYFDISNIQSGKDNPNGYRMVEFPVFNIFQAGAYSLIGFMTLEQWGRLVTIFSSLASILFIFLLVRRYANEPTAVFSAFFYAVLPFSVYYGRVILPDPSASMTILGGMYFLERSIRQKKINFILFSLSLFFTACSFLLKPFTLFFTLPMLYIVWDVYGYNFIKKWYLWVYAALSVIPIILWRMWIVQFPEGIPASSWLFNEGNIRFTGAYFYWILADRVGRLILGYIGYVFLLLGFLKKNDKHFGFFISLAISALVYLIVIARGNVQHDYYQILILPVICMFLGRGVTFLLSLVQNTFQETMYNTFAVFAVIAFVTVGSVFFSWYHIRDYFNINNEGLVIAGKIADKLLPQNAKVIAANDGDTSFLYYINRKGWPAYEKSPDELAQMGATHLVIPNPTEQDFSGLGQQYSTFYSSPQVLILSLSKE